MYLVTKLRPKTSEGRYCSLKQLLQGSQPQSPTANSGFSLPGHVAAAAVAAEDDNTEPYEGPSHSAMFTPQRGSAAANAELQHRLFHKGHASSWLQVAPALVRRLLVHLVHLPANQVRHCIYCEKSTHVHGCGCWWVGESL
eukprot:492661-Pelagomonas_calceolata.AAC.2